MATMCEHIPLELLDADEAAEDALLDAVAEMLVALVLEPNSAAMDAA